MQALVLDAERKTATVQAIDVPSPGPGEALVQVRAIALNPVDALYTLKPIGNTGRVVGSDFAGVVTEVSPGSSLKPGQRVAGFLQGACSRNDRPGAFAEYVTCSTDLLWLLPDHITFEQGATVSLCALTAAQVLFSRLGLQPPFPIPPKQSKAVSSAPSTDPIYFLIYGASTSVGMYTAQLIKHSAAASGKRIVLIGTASKTRFSMLSSAPYSYDHLVDYHSPEWAREVLHLTRGEGISMALDCISEGSTVGDISHALAPAGKMAVLRSHLGGAWDLATVAPGVEPVYGAAWEGLGEVVEYQNFVLPASKEARAFAVAFYRFLSTGAVLEPNPVRLMPGGLDKIVPDGFELLGPGKMGERRKERKEEWMKPISGEKVVYKIVG